VSGRRIYLVASTGFPNYGDELVAAQWLRYIAQHEPDAEVWLDSPSPGNSQLLLGRYHPKARFVDTLFRICWQAPSEDPDEVVAFADRAVRDPGVAFRFSFGVELLQTVDVFHILGGGYINNIWPRHLALLKAGSVLSTDYSARAAITGAGLVPAGGPADLLNRVVDGYSVLDVRDQPSGDLLSDSNVRVGCDDALLDLGDHIYDERGSRSVMVCAQSDLVEGGLDAVVDSVLGTLRTWEVEGTQIGYVEAMPGVDRLVFDRLEPSYPDMRFYPFAEIWREGLPARRGQRWITTRFHLHLLAAAAGAWGVAISVRPDYYDVKHASLTERGSRWATIDAGEVWTDFHGEPGFGNAIAPLLEDKQAVAKSIYGR
jgi:hypothetical protein